MSNTRTVFITGAAGTIGKATAAVLGKQGFRLVLADRNESELVKLAAEIPQATPLVLDVTDGAALAKALNDVSETLAGVVLAAGIEGPVGLFEDCSEEAFNTVMQVNVTTVWLGIKHALKILKPKGAGSIIILSSISGVQGMPMLSPYCASKHAVLGLVRTAAREAAPFGIRVNAVCPGPVDSPMMERIDSTLTKEFPERLGNRKDASQLVPMRHYATPTDIANAISFLCSDDSRYCTGTTMMVDGGITCR